MEAMLFIASVVFVAEIGCILRSACFVDQYGKLPVLLGTILGTAVAAIIGIFLGELIGKSLPHGIAHWISGFILIGIGVWMIFDNHTCSTH